MIDSDGSGTIEAAESFGRIKLRRFGSHRMEMLKYPSGAVDVSNVAIFWFVLARFSLDMVCHDHLLKLLPRFPVVLAGVRMATEPQL